MAHRYRFDDFEIDVRSFRLLKSGQPVSLEPKALNVLVFLVENRGRLVERRELISAVWKEAFVTDHVLNRAVGQLRKALEEDPKQPRYIETAPTLGYRFIASIEEEGEPATPPGRDTAQSPPSISNVGPSRSPASILRQRAAIVLGVTAVAAVLLASWVLTRANRSKAGVSIRSLAVLPLENLSGDSSQDYLADGMTAELITGLGQVDALRVISQTTAMQYKNAHKSLPEIAKELNVDAVVEGSVTRSQDQIRIDARLLDAPGDKLLWSSNYNGDLRDVLGLENQVAAAVADQIRVKLTSAEQTHLAGSRQVNPRAYEALLKGYASEENSHESEQKALQYFRQAAEIDPSFAPAYVGIARAYDFLADSDYLPNTPDETATGVPQGEATAAADAAEAKALQLQPDLAEAYAERGWTLLVGHWDFAGAERDFRHAIELDPSASTAYQGYSAYLVGVGRFDEALHEIQRARDLDPKSPLVLTNYCINLRFARRYDEALAQCSNALKIDPTYGWSLQNMSDVYYLKRDYAEARKTLAQLGTCDAPCTAMLDEVYGPPGASGAFNAWLKEQKVQPGAFFLAIAYTRFGKKDQAFSWLEKAYEQRSDMSAMWALPVDPQFDSLRSDPRFDTFARRVGLRQQPPPAASGSDPAWH